MGPGGAEVDRGLAPERTSLAWERTALALAANAALLLRAGSIDDLPAVRVAGFLVAACAGALFFLARTRHVRRTAALRSDGSWPGSALLVGVGGLAVGVSLVGLVVAVGALVAA